MGKYPNITINMSKFQQNAKNIKELCAKHGIDAYPVVKGTGADRQIVETLVNTGYKVVADSRMENILKYHDLPVEVLLLRLTMPSIVESIIQYVDISLNSEIETIKLLNKEAEKQNKTHKVILMIELGDLREGILQKDVDGIVKEMMTLKNIKLHGVGANLTCYGAVLPDENNLGILCQVAEQIETTYNIKLEVVAGGNSSSIPMMLEGKLPKKINTLRLGEALLNGIDSVDGSLIPGQFQDVFTIEAELIELKDKNSLPTGKTGYDAFGHPFKMPEDKGVHRRGIVAIGRQDMELDALIPEDNRISIIGASGDHCILDLEKVKDSYKIGDIIRFRVKYSSMMRAMTSSYVTKVYQYDKV